MAHLRPLHFNKVKFDKIWGEETWLLSGREESPSIVDSEGTFNGRSLPSLVEEYGSRLLGKKCSISKEFPLLFKRLHAESSLSLQVHPSISSSLGEEAKTEMWMSIGKSSAFLGLRDGITKMHLLNGALGPEVPNYLRGVELQDKQMVLINAGRVHALMKGDVFEVSQNSSTTYRLYDWDREGREMHVEKGIESIDFNLKEPLTSYDAISCPFFKCAYWPNGTTISSNEDSFTVVYVIDFDDCTLVPAGIGQDLVDFKQKCLTVTID